MATKAFLEKAYLAYFGRPVDPAGLTDFAASTDTQVADAFAASAESKALYGTTFDYAQINAIYLALFNREAEKAGLEYWYAKVADKTFTAAGAAIAILNGAQNADKTAIENKLVASAAFSAALDTSAEMVGYSGTAAAASARAFLSTVTTTAPTAAAVDAAIASAVAAKTAVAGQTFTLTTSVDTGTSFTGGAGNDTFNATHLTFGAADVIVGGTGTDSLILVDSGATAFTVPAASVSGIENITVRNINTATATAAVSAVSAVAAVRQVQTIISTVAVSDKANALTVTYAGASVTTAVTDGGATAAEVAALLAPAINALAGSAIATVIGNTVVVTAPVAGTALPTIAVVTTVGTLGASTNITHAITDSTANVAAVAAVSAVTAITAATAQTASVTASNFVGATSFTSETSTGLLALSALTSAQTANLVGGSGGITAGYGATVAAGTVNISGGTTAGAVAINGAALKTLDITSSGAVNTLGAISSDSAVVSAVNLTATTAMLATGLTVANAGAIPAVALTISGAAGDRAASSSSAARSAVTLGALDTDFTTINASGLTAGGVSATLSATTTATFTGGSGSDRITTSTSGQLGAVNAGAGTDTLILADTTHMDTAAEGAIYTGFEVLSVADNVAIDMDTFTGSTITAVAIADAANATSVTDMSATQAANVTIAAGAGALTLGVKDATTVGTQNVLNITVSDGDTTTSEAVWGTADVTLAGVETINITATDDVTFNTLANISGLGTLTVTGPGDVSLTTSTQALTTNSVFNAAGVTGTVVINAGGGTGFGAAITGSATNTNTLTGTILGDVIIGGANVDTIASRLTGASTTAGDTITTGAGFDTVTLIGAAAAAASTNYDAAPRITDFTVGTAANNTDLIRFDDDDTDYLEVGAAEGLSVVGTKEGAAGAVVVQNVAQNAGAAAGATGAEFIKLTTGVAFTTSIQGSFNAAIGTSTVTTLTADSVFLVSYYDTTNSRMVILGADITAGTTTTLETGDVVTLIGTINMSAADYALVDADNFAAFI